MLKDTEIKKIVKNFNKYGKGLRPDGIYTFNNNTIYSAIKNSIHGTPGGFSVTFHNDLIHDNAFYLLCKNDIINGTDLNRIISGTGVKIKLDEQEIITKIENNEAIWDCQIPYNIKRDLLYNYGKYSSLIEDNIQYEIDFPEDFIQMLKDMKNFIIDISDYIELPNDIKVLKISNKLLKNFSKDTTKITLQISGKYDDIRVVKYIVRDDIAETESIYGLLIQ